MMHPTQRRRRFRALFLTVLLSLGGTASAVPQLGTSVVMSPAAWPEASTAPADATAAAEYPREHYAGRDEQGVPRYLDRAFIDDERRLLREQFGIEEPGRLYLSDTLPSASLTYDSDWDRGERDLVGSYRVGATSVRLPGETWEALERRLAATSPASFPAATRRPVRSLAALDSTVRPGFERLLQAARRAGFRVRVTESRRSPERQAYLLTLDGHLTHTATSRHADGFAVDVVVDDGNLRNPVTRKHWTAFRRWVLATRGAEFRLIGAPDRSWDWPHIESVDGPPAFRSVEELLAAARRCAAAGLADCTLDWRPRASGEPVALVEGGVRKVVEE
jgi:hypothetical protein